MKNVLIITSTYDLTVDYMITNFSNKVNFYRLNTNIFDYYDITLTNEGFNIKCDEWEIREAQIHSIYYRKPLLPSFSNYDESYKPFMAKELISFIKGKVNNFEGKVLSKPIVLEKGESKIEQLRVAQSLGMKVPESIITNNQMEAKEFIRRYDNKVIIKPIKAGKIDHGSICDLFTTKLIDPSLEISNISETPIYLQKYIEKDYELRITIINGHIYPVRIDAENTIDWRESNDNNEYRIVQIDESLKKFCLDFLSIYDLEFGAFDFIVSEGNYVFLENNPNGQWLWLEELLNLNISNEIIRFLGK